MEQDRSGVLFKFNPEFLAGFQAEATGVRVTDEQVAVAVDAGPELRLPAADAAGRGRAAFRQLPALGFGFCLDKRAIEAFFEKPPAGSDISTPTGDVIFRPIAQRSGFVQQFLADEHFSQ